jgi:hypothetical protein
MSRDPHWYAAAIRNEEFLYKPTPEQGSIKGTVQAGFIANQGAGVDGKGAWIPENPASHTQAHYENVYKVKDKYYWHQSEGPDLYSLYETDNLEGGVDTLIGVAYKDVLSKRSYLPNSSLKQPASTFAHLIRLLSKADAVRLG